MKKKSKEPSKFVTKWKELWAEKRTRAALSLGLWLAFFAVAFTIIGIADAIIGKNPPKPPTPVAPSFQSYDKMKEDLLKNNYAYEYDVNANEEHILFSGTKTSKKDIGYKQKNDQILKYLIENGQAFSMTLDSKVPITDLYENINPFYFNVTNIFNMIKNISPEETTNNSFRQFSYQVTEVDATINITVTTDLTAITKIVILKNNESYTFKYSQIGLIKEEN